MKKKLVYVFSTILITILIIIINSSVVSAEFNMWGVSATSTSVQAFQEVIDVLQTIGSVLSIIVLIIIGIKYMLGSVDEKAEYKNTMMPYVIGATLVFAISNLIPMIRNTVSDIAAAGTIENMGGKVINILGTVGSIVSVIILIVLGIKYMLGSTEAKANYKKSMLPYLIGAIVLFAASAIATAIYNFAIKI